AIRLLQKTSGGSVVPGRRHRHPEPRTFPESGLRTRSGRRSVETSPEKASRGETRITDSRPISGTEVRADRGIAWRRYRNSQGSRAPRSERAAGDFSKTFR